MAFLASPSSLDELLPEREDDSVRGDGEGEGERERFLLMHSGLMYSVECIVMIDGCAVKI